MKKLGKADVSFVLIVVFSARTVEKSIRTRVEKARALIVLWCSDGAILQFNMLKLSNVPHNLVTLCYSLLERD